VKILGALFDKFAGASGASLLPFLPWALLGVGVAVSAAGALGWHEGAKITAASYEAQKADAMAVAARANIAAIKRIAGISLDIVVASKDYVTELNLTSARRKEIVKKVTEDAKAHVAAACVVPAATAGLRREQVAESIRIAAPGYSVRP
jgi:hypothetical protein